MSIPSKITVFDTETTSANPLEARILTCYAATYDRDMNVLAERHWLIDPGVEVPEGASEVNGLTTEYVREHGRKDWANAVNEIVGFLSEGSAGGGIIAAHNLPYDLSALSAEIYRGWRDDEFWPEIDDVVFLDTLTLDKALDKYRRGNRKLATVAEHYGVTIEPERLHEASYDVELCAQIAWKLLEKWHPRPLADLFDFQREAKREQAASLQQWLRDNRDPEAVVSGEWPLIRGGV